jgi:hypothetical protein
MYGYLMFDWVRACPIAVCQCEHESTAIQLYINLYSVSNVLKYIHYSIFAGSKYQLYFNILLKVPTFPCKRICERKTLDSCSHWQTAIGQARTQSNIR